MKTWVKKQGILLLLILLGILAALGVVWNRVRVEQENRVYDIVMDRNSLAEMVEESSLDMEDWLGYFREWGVDKLAIQEESISTLVEEHPGIIQAQTPEDACAQYGWQERYPQVVQEQLMQGNPQKDVLVTIQDEELLDWVTTAFENRCDRDIWFFQEDDGTGFLYLSGDDGSVTGLDLIELPLGISPEKQAQAEEYGYTIVPRTVPVDGLNGDVFAQSVLEDYARIGTPYIIGTVPGYDNRETVYPRMQEFLEENQVTLGMVENNTQSKNQVEKGLGTLVEATGYNVVRVFTMWDYVQWRYGWYQYDGPQEITNCLYRAVYERNCRLVYLKMMMQEDPNEAESYRYITDPSAYETLLSDFTGRMTQRGYTMETLTAAESISVPFFALVLIALGAVAAAVLLLGLLCPLGWKLTYGLTLLGALGATGVLYLMPNTGRLILSIGGGIVVPILAVAGLGQWLRHTRGTRVLVDCLGAVVVIVVMGVIGGLFAAAPLSDSAYMLEMELYRGVKIMQLVPLGFFVCYVIWEWLSRPCENLREMEQHQRKQTLQQMLDAPVKVKNALVIGIVLVILGILAAVGSYYLARTGHTEDVGVADLELELRNLMEYYLVARPRTKEFLVGYPCVMLYVWCRRKETRILQILSALPGLGAVIGATSVVNTFLHIRTPYLLSLIRVGIGFAFGVVLGLLAVAVAEGIYRSVLKRKKYV